MLAVLALALPAQAQAIVLQYQNSEEQYLIMIGFIQIFISLKKIHQYFSQVADHHLSLVFDL